MLASYVDDIHWNTLVTNYMTILKVRDCCHRKKEEPKTRGTKEHLLNDKIISQKAREG